MGNTPTEVSKTPNGHNKRRADFRKQLKNHRRSMTVIGLAIVLVVYVSKEYFQETVKEQIVSIEESKRAFAASLREAEDGYQLTLLTGGLKFFQMNGLKSDPHQIQENNWRGYEHLAFKTLLINYEKPIEHLKDLNGFIKNPGFAHQIEKSEKFHAFAQKKENDLWVDFQDSVIGKELYWVSDSTNQAEPEVTGTNDFSFSISTNQISTNKAEFDTTDAIEISISCIPFIGEKARAFFRAQAAVMSFKTTLEQLGIDETKAADSLVKGLKRQLEWAKVVGYMAYGVGWGLQLIGALLGIELKAGGE